MTYPKHFTDKILELEAHGFTVQETVDYLRGHGYPGAGIATVCRHRKGPLSDARANHKSFEKFRL